MSKETNKVPLRIEDVRNKHTKSPYLGDYTPEEVLKHKFELLKQAIKQSSEAWEEYITFLDWYMSFEDFSAAVVLTIAHKQHLTKCEIEMFDKELTELYEDAKIMGIQLGE